MKKIIICIFAVLFSTSVFAEKQVASSDVMGAWGSPEPLHTTPMSVLGKGINRENGGGNIILVYMARKIVPHGGYFCFTTLDVAITSGGGRGTVYRNAIGEQCAWYCENGYAGEGCTAGDGTNCNMKTIGQADIDNAQIYKSGGGIKQNLVNDKGMFIENRVFGVLGADTILVAMEILTNGRGIKAQPITFFAGNWDYNQQKTTETAMSVETNPSSSTLRKTLCAEGWTGSDCNTRTDVCTACPDNRVFIVDKDACSAGKLDPEHPGDKAYSCDGDRTKYMNHEGNCAGKGYTSASDIISKNCWKTSNSYDFHKCMNPTK
ncbi:MAG: hypothetical protein ACOX7D_02930 [Alphaproteobacteria bacterium]|jgi:hypothetical protein